MCFEQSLYDLCPCLPNGQERIDHEGMGVDGGDGRIWRKEEVPSRSVLIVFPIMLEKKVLSSGGDGMKVGVRTLP